MLGAAVSRSDCDSLRSAITDALTDSDRHTRSRRGNVYAARNLIDHVAQTHTVWQNERLLSYLRRYLGSKFGLVRVLFFDKPPEQSWSLAWHRDESIAVIDNQTQSTFFSRPTIKAGVPHLVADRTLLDRMLTLRIHLDQVTDENGPLKLIPRSHAQCDAAVDMDGHIVIHADVGDVLAMRPRIFHASGGCQPGTRRHRRVLHLEFAPDALLPDGVRWHRFIQPN